MNPKFDLAMELETAYSSEHESPDYSAIMCTDMPSSDPEETAYSPISTTTDSFSLSSSEPKVPLYDSPASPTPEYEDPYFETSSPIGTSPVGSVSSPFQVDSPQDPNYQSSEEATVANPPIKRKRGRPPKKHGPSGGISKAAQAKAVTVPVIINGVPIKRGRGRPRKNPPTVQVVAPVSAAVDTGKQAKLPSDTEICKFVKELIRTNSSEPIEEYDAPLTTEVVKRKLEGHFHVDFGSRRHFVNEVFQVLRV